MIDRVVVLADDRTGALETAGGLARDGLTVRVAPTDGPLLEFLGARSVVDLSTRHLAAVRAGERASRLAADQRVAGAALLVKMDSTLRGNWPTEVVAVTSVRRSPTVIVAAFPAVGRTCVGGEVLEHGVPVSSGPAGADARRPVTSSRITDLLAAAGADSVVSCADPAALVDWFETRPAGIAVCDASTDDDLAAYGRVWATRPGALFVGTAASIAAAVAAAESPGMLAPRPPAVARPALVCIGSLHPAARQQATVLAQRGWTVEVLGESTDAVVGDRHVVVTPAVTDGRGDEAAAVALAELASRRLEERTWATVVVVGGDTAAAVLGPRAVSVGGLLGPGIPWGHLDGGGPLVITKPGGFGGPDAIARLFGETA